MSFSCEKSFSVSYYTEAETLKVPCQKESSELKMSFPYESSFSVSYYTKAEFLKVPCQKEISEYLASQFYWKTFRKEGINVTKLKGKLLMENGRHHLLLDDDKKTSLRNSSLVRCGLTDYHKLIPELSKMGINASMELVKDDVESQNVCLVHTEEPYKALIEIGKTSTVITTAESDANVASILYKAIDNILDGV